MLALLACLPAVDQGAGLGIEVQGIEVLEGEVGEVQGQEKASLPATALPRSLVWLAARAAANGAPSEHGVEGRVLVGVGRALITEGIELGEGHSSIQASAQLGGAVHHLQLADGARIVLGCLW